ncbi:MAG: hydroxymethylbilane synthase [Antricoccus sp.]
MSAAPQVLRLGTRTSLLARSQSQHVADQLTAVTGHRVELVEIITRGDLDPGPLHAMGGQGVFTSALRDALYNRQVDFAVHSLKDLPTATVDGLTIAAIPPREDPRDALIARDGLTIGQLPPGATVGTGSLRRSAQLRAMGLDLQPVPIRGNVDSRLRKVQTGELDAVVLAASGLRRLGRADLITESIDPIAMLPAPGQGALAIEALEDNTQILDLLNRLDDHYSRLSVTAERAVLAELEAGCSSPVGALAEVVDAEDGLLISLRASVTALDGSDAVRNALTAPLTDAEIVGARLARILLEDGATDFMGARE